MSPGAIIDGAPAGVTDTQAATILTSPLSINGVPARRSKAPKISGAVAPFASSSMFKGPSSGKPMAKRWDSHLSPEAKSRAPSTLKAAVKHLKDPRVISLGGGLPTSDYFPFDSMSVKVPRPPGFTPQETHAAGQTLDIGKHDYRDGKSLYDIHIAMNYGQGSGSAQLLRFVTEHTEIVHNPPYEDWLCNLTCGSTSSLDMCFRMLCSRGDAIISEEYTFCSAVETAIPMGVRTFAVGMDGQGMKADALDHLLHTWDAAARGSPKPRVLYTVPTGQNPTGATQSAQRRRAIYAVCQRHDVIIIEDEPYYFLQMDPYSTASNAPTAADASHEQFLKALVPSYLSIDVDGRVLRLDSFSKVLAPGTRVGWITGAEQLMERFVRHAEVSTQNPCGMAQLVLYKLLEEGWGHEGYLDWLQYIRREYTNRRNILMRACEEFLPQEVASWKPPMAGMFHWIKVDWRKHPRANRRLKPADGELNGAAPATPLGALNGTVHAPSHASPHAASNGQSDGQNGRNGSSLATESDRMLDIEDKVHLAVVAEGTLVSRGSWFRAEQDGGTEMFFRATFAAASEEDIREATRRLGVALRKEFALPV